MKRFTKISLSALLTITTLVGAGIGYKTATKQIQKETHQIERQRDDLVERMKAKRPELKHQKIWQEMAISQVEEEYKEKIKNYQREPKYKTTTNALYSGLVGLVAGIIIAEAYDLLKQKKG